MPDSPGTPLRPPQTPRVLIVEDEPRLRELLVDVLPDMNFEPIPTASAEKAFNYIDKNPDAPPHAVLLDLNLPVMGGLDFLTKFRDRNAFKKTPVIIMTGFGDLPAAQQAIRLGVTEFLTKPCHLGEIEAALGRARHKLFDQTAAPTDIPSTDGSLTGLTSGGGEAITIAELEKRAIMAALRRTGGNRSAAAIELGISRRTLYNKLAEYDAPPPEPPESPEPPEN